MTTPDQHASVRYIVDDVQAAVDFYTTHLGFTLSTSAAPAFADVVRGPLRLLLSGPASSGTRATPADATAPGRNRIHLIVDSLDAEIDRLRGAGVSFRSDSISGPGGRHVSPLPLPSPGRSGGAAGKNELARQAGARGHHH